MDITQMIAILECYIHLRTNKEVRIDTNNLDLFKLTQAHNIAQQWLSANNGRIDHYVG